MVTICGGLSTSLLVVALPERLIRKLELNEAVGTANAVLNKRPPRLVPPTITLPTLY